MHKLFFLLTTFFSIVFCRVISALSTRWLSFVRVLFPYCINRWWFLAPFLDLVQIKNAVEQNGVVLPLISMMKVGKKNKVRRRHSVCSGRKKEGAKREKSLLYNRFCSLNHDYWWGSSLNWITVLIFAVLVKWMEMRRPPVHPPSLQCFVY